MIVCIAVLVSSLLAAAQSSQYQGYSHGYHGPTAIPYVLHDGHIADTQEVAAAKAEHFAAVAKDKSYGGYGHGYSGQYATGYGGYDGYSQDGGYYSGYYGNHGHSHHTTPYHGPLAKPVVLHNGYLSDTQEVAAAKSLHLAAVAKAKVYGHYYSKQYSSGYGGYHGYSQDGGYDTGYYGNHGYSHHTTPYHGALAKPVVIHNGYLADTQEVAAAKSLHLAAVAKAKAYGHDYSKQYASGYGGYHGYSQDGVYDTGYYGNHGYSHHTTPYHGPLAKPVVLHNGYLADTQEVAAAKHHHLGALHSGHHGSYGHY